MRRGVKIFLMAVGAGLAVILGTALFIRNVSNQLWEQSVNDILAITEQGRTALDIQLDQNMKQLESIAGYVKQYDSSEKDEVIRGLKGLSGADGDIFLYNPQNGSVWGKDGMDRTAAELIEECTEEEGMIEPHISSVTGMQVFNMFQKVLMPDGTRIFIVKEYQVRDIADQFTLSFYNDAGFSYIVNRQGDILIRPSHTNSNKTARTLTEMISGTNDSSLVEQFGQALMEKKKGVAVFHYGQEDMTFCYVPLKGNSSWYLVSIIPQSKINAQTQDILLKTLMLLVLVILSIVLLALYYLRGAKRTGRMLENHANFITHLYNSIPEGICQLMLKPPFEIVRMNPEGMRLLDFDGPEGQAAGKRTVLSDLVHPDDWGQTSGIFSQASATGQRYTYSCRARVPGGSYIWVGGLVEKARDTEGNEILINTFHDITMAREQEEVKEQEHSLERSLLISAVSGIYPLIASYNLDRDLYQVLYQADDNLLAIPGDFTYGQIAGIIGESAHPDDRELFYSRFGPDAFTRNADMAGTYMDGRFLLMDRQYHWVSLQMIPVQTDASRDRIFIIMLRIIDEQKHEEQQRLDVLQSALDSANAANHAKSDFLSKMSHDIRTPMNAIVGMTSIAENHIENREKVKYCLSRISDSSTHLLSLINDVLDMSKIESGKMVLHNEPFSLGREINGLVTMLAPQAESKNLKLETRMPPLRHDAIIGDALRFRQIFLNIAGNAIKFTPPGGQITLEMEELEPGLKDYGSYQFIFDDTGPGMPEDFLERLFEPFERARTDAVQKEEGTGLGMSITKNIIDLMNGSIHVESQTGKGSRFTVTLHFRLQEYDGEQDSRKAAMGNGTDSRTGGTDSGTGGTDSGTGADRMEAEGKSSAMGLQGMRILLVEDNELNREIARELLSVTGLEIDEACDGVQAVEKMAASPEGYYSMIITDIQMPRMDGCQAARQIRSMERKDAGTIPIIAMTANAFSDDVETVREAGMNGHIAKPVDTRVLYEILNRFLVRGDSAEFTHY